MDFTGTIKKIGELENGKNDFKKSQVILVTDEQYPQPMAIDFLQEKSDLPEVYQEGDKIKISVNHRGREWTSPTGDIKYFNSIVGWKIEKLS